MCIENMAQEHDFVRVVFHVKGISPCVKVYTEKKKKKKQKKKTKKKKQQQQQKKKKKKRFCC